MYRRVHELRFGGGIVSFMTTSAATREGDEERDGNALRGGVWVAPRDNPPHAEPSGVAWEQLQHLPTRTYARGDFVYRTGDLADGFYVLLEGRVKLSLPDPVRGERVVAVCGEGDLFGATAYGQEQRHHAEAVSLVDGTRVTSLSCTAFEELAQERSHTAIFLIQVLAARVQTLEEEAEYASLPVQARLARTLLQLAQKFGGEVAPGIYDLQIELRQNEIASLAGATRVSATEALGAWRSMGIVSGTRGHYQIDTRRLSTLLELLEADYRR